MGWLRPLIPSSNGFATHMKAARAWKWYNTKNWKRVILEHVWRSTPEYYIVSVFAQSIRGGWERQSIIVTPPERKVSAPQIPKILTGQRPGWIDQPKRQVALPGKQRVSFKNPRQKRDLWMVCHESYEHNQYVCDCFLPFRHQRRAIQNYERLTPLEKLAVQATSYYRGRKILAVEDYDDRTNTFSSHSPVSY